MMEDFLNNISEEAPEIIYEIKSPKNFKNEENIFYRNKKKKSRGGYRPVLIAGSQLVQESYYLKSKFEVINSQYVSNPDLMMPQDIVSYYILCYLDQRYPNQLLENFNPISKNKVKSKFLIDVKFQPRNKNAISRLKKAGAETLFDVVNSFNLHSVPITARKTLINWYLDQYNLKLFINKIPSSKDVLQLQARSERCVSLIADKIDCLVLNERDPLSFLIHDLVHAFKMFNNEYLMRGQVGFCRAVLRLFYNDETREFLDRMCSTDTVFGNQFDYLISDMNSHPRHLFLYFKAILINGIKRKFNLGKEEFLNSNSLKEFNKIFDFILHAFGMNEMEKKISKKLILDENQHDCCSIDFSQLDNFFGLNYTKFCKYNNLCVSVILSNKRVSTVTS
ncbi:hypothetical protein BpHYR1_001821 [Brachionus plicatilis]|uniref:Uncharacterized protein n=1 Tax=Brachionus plicatilis TaxID=10195 RepID=A0A3M7SL14_BRAPC|nr:hypothetical protein BpHYR1_001821 [Brachionus plicatilis]